MLKPQRFGFRRSQLNAKRKPRLRGFQITNHKFQITNQLNGSGAGFALSSHAVSHIVTSICAPAASRSFSN
jgi:hypothetical protein